MMCAYLIVCALSDANICAVVFGDTLRSHRGVGRAASDRHSLCVGSQRMRSENEGAS